MCKWCHQVGSPSQLCIMYFLHLNVETVLYRVRDIQTKIKMSHIFSRSCEPNNKCTAAIIRDAETVIGGQLGIRAFDEFERNRAYGQKIESHVLRYYSRQLHPVGDTWNLIFRRRWVTRSATEIKFASCFWGAVWSEFITQCRAVARCMGHLTQRWQVCYQEPSEGLVIPFPLLPELLRTSCKVHPAALQYCLDEPYYHQREVAALSQ